MEDSSVFVGRTQTQYFIVRPHGFGIILNLGIILRKCFQRLWITVSASGIRLNVLLQFSHIDGIGFVFDQSIAAENDLRKRRFKVVSFYMLFVDFNSFGNLPFGIQRAGSGDGIVLCRRGRPGSTFDRDGTVFSVSLDKPENCRDGVEILIRQLFEQVFQLGIGYVFDIKEILGSVGGFHCSPVLERLVGYDFALIVPVRVRFAVGCIAASLRTAGILTAVVACRNGPFSGFFVLRFIAEILVDGFFYLHPRHTVPQLIEDFIQVMQPADVFNVIGGNLSHPVFKQ